jgi:hypothetical protein
MLMLDNVQCDDLKPKGKSEVRKRKKAKSQMEPARPIPEPTHRFHCWQNR